MSTPTDDAPRTVQDLQRITGLGRELVKAGIRTGELPGHKVGNRYTIPAEAFRRFCRGEWQPHPRPLFPRPVKPLPQPAQLVRKTS